MIRNHMIVGLFVLFSQLSSDVLAAEKETKDSPLLALQNYVKALKAGDTKAAKELTAAFETLPAEYLDRYTTRYADAAKAGELTLKPISSLTKTDDDCAVVIFVDGNKPRSDLDPAFLIKQDGQWKVLLKLTQWDHSAFQLTIKQQKRFSSLHEWFDGVTDGKAASNLPFNDLGEQYVNALRNKDIVLYGQCWISSRQARAVAIASKAPVPEEQLAAMDAYFADRNRHVAHSYKVLTEFFEKEGDITRLKLTGIEGAVRARAGILRTSGFRISVALDKATYSIRIDDGLEGGGSWFFSDKPMALEVLADKKRISLQIPSNDK